MPQNTEYTGPSVGQQGCSYSSLKRTYGMSNSMGVSANVGNMASYDVPDLCGNNGPSYPPKYNTLSHGQANTCGGHFSMKGAYPFADCQSCNAPRIQRPCNGNVNCNRSQVSESFRHLRR